MNYPPARAIFVKFLQFITRAMFANNFIETKYLLAGKRFLWQRSVQDGTSSARRIFAGRCTRIDPPNSYLYI